ncbi:InlB B-repeat-containing protein [Mycoplasma bradburyae]|uniref:InlB B-repeat-containing protein n=1 Tax=Mycoplasma bradburyae TaxID=2963128 RepID=UPI0023417071|nr:InlB B-repeat-containing protein [Mycoplasma bradburyae]MDC4184114.1 InlB B-repeat-containing protein [Mycoplasma bradburyae]
MKSIKKSFITKLLSTTVFSSTFLISILSGNIKNQFWSPNLVNNSATTLRNESGKNLISFNANGGTGVMNNVLLKDRDPIPKNKFSRNGYKFIGWGTNPSDKNPRYVDRGAFFGNGNVTLYAIWSTDAKKLTFNTIGASSELVNLWVKPGSTINLPGSEGNLFFDGRFFDGWADTKEGLRKWID